MRTIPKKETLTIEFKSDLKNLNDNDLIEAIVGITNTDGGVLYLALKIMGRLQVFIDIMPMK